MEFDKTNARSVLDNPARACTAARQGIWTLWWRYESLRSRAAELHAGTDEESFLALRDRETERALVAAEIARLSEMLEANGILVHSNEKAPADGGRSLHLIDEQGSGATAGRVRRCTPESTP